MAFDGGKTICRSSGADDATAPRAVAPAGALPGDNAAGRIVGDGWLPSADNGAAAAKGAVATRTEATSATSATTDRRRDGFARPQLGGRTGRVCLLPALLWCHRPPSKALVLAFVAPVIT